MEWANPEWFWALLGLPLLVAATLWRYFSRRYPSLTYSSTSYFKAMPGNWRAYGLWLVPVFLWSGYVLIVLALARPQYEHSRVERQAEGIDIVMAVDMSTSMKAEDLEPNRFEAARQVASDFIDGRVSDRIGLVGFARKSFTVCPPTLDYRLIKRLLRDLEMGMIEDGTAIGMGLSTAVNRLKESRAESKVIILLTDGQNNSGEIDPVTAAELAQTYNIKIYTIGAGSKGSAPYPVQDPLFGRQYRNVKVNIDEEMLRNIADMTGGRYFRATDTEELQSVYDEIDKLEKTEIDEMIYTDYEELYLRFLLPGIILLMLSLVTEKVFFRTIY